ncbi:MAG TPA: hypothetical protein VKZ54_12385 [Membranihabitans sp.]|nr:hypothetical protein [Membranihabitans sp.]
MKLSSTIYTSVIFLVIATIPALIIYGINRVSEEELQSLRKEQIQAARYDSGRELVALKTSGDVVLEDYFVPSGYEYRYLGGLTGAPWEVGESYPLSDLKAHQADQHDFGIYGQQFGDNNYYVNIDRGDEKTPAQFLRVMDRHRVTEVDSLVLDFRFLRTIEFGAVLRLFNQIAPSRKVVLGTILDKYQEEVILSSGRPFFTSIQTIFLVDEKIPDPVKHLVANLSQYTGYSIAGELGPFSDTVCLSSQYTVGDNLYRICSEKWTSDRKEFHNPGSERSLPDSIRISSLRQMDVAWYKNRDSVAVSRLVPEFHRALLP